MENRNNIIFLGGLFPEEIKTEIENKSKGVIQNAANVLQWAVVKGLDFHTTRLRLLNLPYVGSYPLRYLDFKLRSFNFSHNGKAEDINAGFLNLSIFKFYSRYLNSKSNLNKMIKEGDEIIIIYAMHLPFIKAAIKIKKKYPSIKVCLIVPDLPQYMGGKNNFLFRLLKFFENTQLENLIQKVDAFVILSKYMVGPLKIGSRPWVVVEGIYNPEKIDSSKEKEELKTILYTGTLAKRYGILNLLDAFSLIKNENFRLWICGDGDAIKEINDRAKLDSRISNLGQLPRERVLDLQQRATVLVNPRTSEGEFTKFSFPSKVMEYLGSGTPCIMYSLPGIPEEYFDYCFVVSDESIEALSKSILNVCNKPQNELNAFGMRAKEFVIKNKAPKMQTLKVFNMLSNLNIN